MRRSVLAPARTPRIGAWPSKGIHAAWIGHSTVVLSIDGFTILTDPVFSRRIGLAIGPVTLGFKRLVAPALPLAEIPAPDLILLSHAHMDHFDLPTLRKFENPHSTVITAANTSDLLRGSSAKPRYAAIDEQRYGAVNKLRYAAVKELRWNETAQVGPASVRAFEVRHWGARMRSDTYRGYNGYLIEVGRYRVVFGGDTAFTDSFKQIRSSRPVDLALMPIGAYDPWIAAHCTPEQALAMANHAGAEFVLPLHHRTFQLSRERDGEPMERLLAAAAPDERRICVRDFGDEFHLK